MEVFPDEISIELVDSVKQTTLSSVGRQYSLRWGPE